MRVYGTAVMVGYALCFYASISWMWFVENDENSHWVDFQQIGRCECECKCYFVHWKYNFSSSIFNQKIVVWLSTKLLFYCLDSVCIFKLDWNDDYLFFFKYCFRCLNEILRIIWKLIRESLIVYWVYECKTNQNTHNSRHFNRGKTIYANTTTPTKSTSLIIKD